MPTSGQLALLVCSVLCFAEGLILSLLRLRWDRALFSTIARALSWCGIIIGAAVLAWHSALRENWLPLEDNFDTLIWLGLLLAAFVKYMQRRRPLGGLDWFIMPIVILLLVGAAIFGRTKPHQYLPMTWSVVHRVTAYGGAVAFAIAAAVGAMYLYTNNRLRKKTFHPGPNLGSLERLEHLTFTSVTLGFALLTIGLVTGMIWSNSGANRLGPHWFASPKVLLALGTWVVYAIVLHSPINPSFRGRKAAMLSIFGFALMIAVMIAVQFMPQGASH